MRVFRVQKPARSGKQSFFWPSLSTGSCFDSNFRYRFGVEVPLLIRVLSSAVRLAVTHFTVAVETATYDCELPVAAGAGVRRQSTHP